MIIIGVGTENKLKIKAAKVVFESIFRENEKKYIKIRVKSGVPHQPIGLEEVLLGSKNRALEAYSYIKKEFHSKDGKESIVNNQVNYKKNNEPKNLLLGIGIEAGLVEIPYTKSGYFDYQFCTIKTSHMISYGSGPGWEYPKRIVDTLLKDRNKELGDIMENITEDKTIRYNKGAIGHFSKELVNRFEITTMAVKMALIPILNQNEYHKNMGER